MEEVKKSPGKTKRIALWSVAIVLIWACLTGIFFLLINPNSSEKFQGELQALDTNFALYYPDKLPETIKLSPNSVHQDGDLVTYSLTQGASTIFVAQQPRPNQMEEVNKIKDVASPLGKAYIANLDKRSVGFLLTDETLVIISSTDNLEAATLEALLQNVTAL